MKYQKIFHYYIILLLLNLIDDTMNQPSKFKTRNN